MVEYIRRMMSLKMYSRLLPITYKWDILHSLHLLCLMYIKLVEIPGNATRHIIGERSEASRSGPRDKYLNGLKRRLYNAS
jgi:hypothetical protein